MSSVTRLLGMNQAKPVFYQGSIASIVAFGLAISCLAFVLARHLDDARVKSDTEAQADWRARYIERKLEIAETSAQAVAVYVATEDTVSAENFHRFATLAHAEGHGDAQILWAPWVSAEDRGAFIGAAHRAGRLDYDILDRAADRRLVSASARANYLPPLFEESYGAASARTGLDFLAVPERATAILLARDTGAPVASPPHRLSFGAEDDETAVGFSVFWPVYAAGAVPATLEARRSALRGMVVSRFRFDRLLAQAVPDLPNGPESIAFFVDGGPDGNEKRHVADYDPVSDQITIDPPARAAAPTALSLSRGFEILGRNWTLVSNFSPAYIASQRLSAPWGVLVFGWLLTALVATHFQRERSRRHALEGVSSDLTDALCALRTEAEARKRVESRLVQSQKMEAIGNLTGGMAHDFNNLLGIILGNLELLRLLTTGAAEVDELVDESLEAVTRGADLTRRLLAFARLQPLEPQYLMLNALVADMFKLLGRTLGEHIEVSFAPAADLWPVVADLAQLEASLVNLANNARDAMPRSGRLSIVTANRSLDADYAAIHPDARAGDYVMIEVSDTGTGMTPEVMERIFEPFFTTKEHGKGTGLGLSMVFGFMRQSGGHINVYSEPGAGTTFRLFLPRAPDMAYAEPKAAAPAPRRADGETVLAVEDNGALRRVVVRQLKELGYRPIEADGAAAALSVLEREQVELVLSDVVMPGDIDGFELARRVSSRWPGIKVVLTSGFPASGVGGDIDALSSSVRLLSKPYRREELAHKLREALDA